MMERLGLTGSGAGLASCAAFPRAVPPRRRCAATRIVAALAGNSAAAHLVNMTAALLSRWQCRGGAPPATSAAL